MTTCIISNTYNNCVNRLSDCGWKILTVEDICKSPDAKFADFEQMVKYYWDNIRVPTEKYLRSLTENQDNDLWLTNFLCGEANISRNPVNAKFCKNSHQRRRTGDAIMAVREALEKIDFNQYHTFREILGKVTDLKNLDSGNKLKGFGELWRYDFSLRYAYHRNIYPEAVYIHAGTAVGLESLLYIKPDIELKVDKKFGKVIDNLSSLPKEIADLGALHIENFLCIFHDHLLRYENHLRGIKGDEGPNYGPYNLSKKDKTIYREPKSAKMRRELDEIYRSARKDGA